MPLLNDPEATTAARLGMSYMKTAVEDESYVPPTLEEDMECFCVLDAA